MSERILWRRTIKPILNKLGHASRIESHSTCSGIPDVNYCIEGINGDMELKHGVLSKPPDFRLSQKVWFRDRIKVGGTPWILYEYNAGNSKSYGLIRGNNASLLYLSEGWSPWISLSEIIWDNKISIVELKEFLIRKYYD